MQNYSKQQIRTGQLALTLEEVEKLLSVVDDFKTEVMLRLAVATGMRREDLAAVKWKDVHWDDRRISFYESKKSRTKDVYVSTEMISKLRQLKNLNPAEHYVFPGRVHTYHGKGHRSGRALYNDFQKYLERAGLRSRPFHALRSTCIKLCERKGWSVAQAAEHVGDTIRVVQEHYSTPSLGEMQQKAANVPII